MKILVALKQVPDTETKIKVAADGKSLDPADVKWITSPYDEYALEEALRLKEAKAAEVVAVSVGEEKAKDILRNALALGADQAVLVRSAETGDPLAVARTLAAFAEGKGFDLLLFGNKGFGADNGAVGAMVAELLGLAQANLVTKLELGEGTFRAEREGDGGTEIVEGSLPAVITAQRGLNEPRYASLKGIMAAKKKPIEEVEGAAVSVAARVSGMVLPPARPEGKKLEGDIAAQAAALLDLLKNEAKVL
jgi:electron transfer flavoprotein beta subunit